MSATTKPATSNGTTPTDTTTFPLDSFKDAAAHLRRPFTAAAVKFKVQAVWPKDEPTGGLIVSYIDARLAIERLNMIVPHLWFDAYRAVGSNQMWCDLTIDGITRSDVGEGTGKGLVSDALKRAAVKFGVGVSLYAIPKTILDQSSGHLKRRKTREGLTLELTPAGESFLRSSYGNWLVAHGIESFGEPLSHGDIEDAQGDAEVEGDALAETSDLATAEDIESLVAAAKGLKVAKIRLALGSVGVPSAEGEGLPFNRVPKAVVVTLAKVLAETAR